MKAKLKKLDLEQEKEESSDPDTIDTIDTKIETNISEIENQQIFYDKLKNTLDMNVSESIHNDYYLSDTDEAENNTSVTGFSNIDNFKNW